MLEDEEVTGGLSWLVAGCCESSSLVLEVCEKVGVLETETGLCATFACLPFLVVWDIVGALLRFWPHLLEDEITSTCSSSVEESSLSVAGGWQAVPFANLSLFN